MTNPWQTGQNGSNGIELAQAEITMACDSQCSAEELIDVSTRALLKNFSDSTSIDLIEDDGSIVRAVTRHADPRKQKILEEHRLKYPLPVTSSYGYPRVIKTGKSQFIPGVSARLADRLFPESETVLAVDGLTVRSYICVPLIAHGRTLGALTVMITDRKRSFTTDDLVVLEEIAAKIAQTLDGR
jgi:GAF domain-containing protein